MTATLGEEKQAMWTLLRSSFAHKLEYWLGMLYPSQVEEAARQVDSLYWEVMETVCGSHLSRVGGPMACTCCPMVRGMCPDIPGLQGSSFQSLTLGLPIKLGGFGLRGQASLSSYAFYGALEQTIPHFDSGLCPQLAHLYGEEELGEARRWEPLLTSDTRTGRELTSCMAKVKQEAEALSTYLGKEVPFQHDSHLAGLGEGRTDGSTRHLMVKEIETLRASASGQGP